MAHHNITINLKDGHALPALPPEGVLNIGDTVAYSSPDGKVRVVFDGPNGSPFGSSLPEVVHDSQIRQLQKNGHFSCKCFIEVGWKQGENPESGGDHDVKP